MRKNVQLERKELCNTVNAYLDQLNELVADPDFSVTFMNRDERQMDDFLSRTTVTLFESGASDQSGLGMKKIHNR